MDPGSPALNISVRWRLDGLVSGAEINLAFAQLLDRHPSLRTYIAEDDGVPVQVIEPFIPFHIPEVDLTGLTEEEAFAEAARIAQQEARVSFELSVPPLIRATHLRVRDNISILLVTIHHVVCDGWSIGILAHEMGLICAAHHAGQAPHLPPLPVSYGEYSEWQTLARSGEAARLDDEFWARSLQGLHQFEIRPDRPRPPVQTSNGHIVSVLLGRDVTDGLLNVSNRCGCTLFATALAALLTLLHRYSGQTDIAVGTQVAVRTDPQLENVVGLFINTIVLRQNLSGDPTLSDLAVRVGNSVLESFEHLDTSLDSLIELLKPKRDLSRNALFSINFIFQRSFIRSENCGSFTLIDMPSCSAGALYDLNFFMVERPDGWRVSCEYNADLFEPETARWMLRHFSNLLSAVVANADSPISSISMIDEAELGTLVSGLKPGDVPYPSHMTMPELFGMQVAHTPDSVAVMCGEELSSYRELDLASNRLAQELQRRGIGRGSRVGICLDRSMDLVVALLAVLKSGGAYVPLDPEYPSARLEHIAKDAGLAALLTKSAFRRRIPTHEAIVILLDEEKAAIGRNTGTELIRKPEPEDVAYVIYTSGSTGHPKGVEIRHRSLTNLLWSMRSEPGLTADDRLVAVTTVSFDIAALELFLPLIVGARVILAREDECRDGGALLALMRRHQATVMQATPITWQILLAADWRADPPVKMLCGGEALPRVLAEQLLRQGGELWNMYGPTETTIWSSVLRVEPGAGPVLIGPPIANTQFYVLDERGQLAPTGVPGELYIGGDGVGVGYLNRAALSQERFVPDRFRQREGAKLYRTGDLVRMRDAGRIEFLGRMDHQIKLRGFRIELGEIESVLGAHEQIAECVVIAVPDVSGEGAIRAYVVPRVATSMDVEALVKSVLAHLRKALPVYMVPSAIVVLPTLPRTPNGKIDRESLPIPAVTRNSDGDSDRPASAIESRVKAIWKDVLGAKEVGLDSNFFEVGGHSLLAVRLLSRLEAEFGHRLTLATLFKYPSIAYQAKLLESGDARAFDFRRVVKLQSNGSRPVLSAINNTGIFYLLAKRLGSDQPFTSLQLFDPSLPNVSLPQTMEDLATEYVELIRRVQWTGPYVLLGWCVAGALAFEVAQRLTASGEKVTHLFLFDTLVPGYLRRLPWLKSLLADYSYRWKLIVADWERAKTGKHPLITFLAHRIVVKKIIQMWTRRPVADEKDLLSSGTSLSPEQYDQWLLRYLQKLADSYQPKRYSGDMTLFRSSQEPMGRFLDPEMGWGTFVDGSLEVVVVDGDHFSIFQEPGVSQMAQHIDSIAVSNLSRN